MQDILDRQDPPLQESGYESYDSETGQINRLVMNTNFQKAQNELAILEEYKTKKYRPEFDEKKCRVISQEADVEDPMTCGITTKTFQICYGPVKERGHNLPSGKNLADYIDGDGQFSMLDFMSDHSKQLPTLWIQGQCEESRRIVEVGCERFFNLAGYVSSPKRTALLVRNYECLSMLSSLIQKVYVDEEWVAQEYLSRCKADRWKASEDEEALKCWNLERIIEAEMMAAPEPIDLTMDEFSNADTEAIETIE